MRLKAKIYSFRLVAHRYGRQDDRAGSSFDEPSWDACQPCSSRSVEQLQPVAQGMTIQTRIPLDDGEARIQPAAGGP